MKQDNSELYKVLFPFRISGVALKKLPLHRACKIFSKMLKVNYVNPETGKVSIRDEIHKIFRKNPVDRSILVAFKRFMIPWFIGYDYQTGDMRETKNIIDLLPLTKEERMKYNGEIERLK